MKKIVLLLSFVAAALSQGNASVVISLGAAGVIRDSLGNPVSNGSIGILVADTGGNQLSDPLGTALTTNSYLGGNSDDLILGVFHATDLDLGAPGFDFSNLVYSYSGSFAPGTSLYLLWFPEISLDNAIVGAGVNYGIFRSDAANPDYGTDSIGWIAPPNGGAYTLVSTDSSLGGTTPNTAFVAQYTTVPEPSTYALLALALGGLVWVVRRPRAHKA